MARSIPDDFYEKFATSVALQQERLMWLATATDSLEKRWIMELIAQAERAGEEKAKLLGKLGHSAFNPVHY